MKGPLKLKVCNQCGAICEATIDLCPDYKDLPKPGFWSKLWYRVQHNKNPNIDTSCQSSDFREIASEEFEMVNKGEVKVFFKQWPSWPSEDAWRQVFAKEGLHKSK